MRDTFTTTQLAAGSRLLLVGGLLLVVAGLATGELFALLLSHTLNADLRAAWKEVLSLAGSAEAGSISSHFDQIHRLAAERARAMSLHSHFGPYGLLAAALAVAKTRFGQSGRYDLPAALLILGGGAMQSLGFLWLDYGGGEWSSISNIGAALMIVGLFLYCPGLLPSADLAAGIPGPREAGGRMLRIGAVLVFAGLLFGLYLAWRHVFFEEPHMHAALRGLVGAIVDGDQALADSLYADFKGAQIRMAITAASHSHAVAFGFIMIVTALTAPQLKLGRVWRNAAFVLIVGGGVLLPVFVYLAPRYGYAFALCADSAGGLAILGLLVVLYGLIPGRKR